MIERVRVNGVQCTGQAHYVRREAWKVRPGMSAAWSVYGSLAMGGGGVEGWGEGGAGGREGSKKLKFILPQTNDEEVM